MKIFRPLTITALAVCFSGVFWLNSSHVMAANTKIAVQSWQFCLSEDQDQGKLMVDAFNEKYPDIEVELRYYQYTDHYTKMKLDLATGQGADVLGLQVGAPLKEFSTFLTPLAPLAEEEWGENWREQFYDSSYAQVDSFDSSFFAFPYALSFAGVMWADESILEKHGVSVPTSWDELKAVTKTLQENGELPMVIGAKDAWINLDVFMAIANDLASSKLYDAIDGKAEWTDPDLVAALNLWQQMFTENIFQQGALGVSQYMDAYNLWTEKKAPLQPNGSWEMGSFNPATDGYADFMEHKRGVYRFPDMNGDGVPAPVVSTPDVVWGLNNSSPNKDAAWKFIKFMVAEEGQQLMTNRLAFFPVKKGVTPTVGLDDTLKAIHAKFVEFGAQSGGYREIPYAELKQALADQLQYLAVKQTTPEKAAAEIEQASKSAKR